MLPADLDKLSFELERVGADMTDSVAARAILLPYLHHAQPVVRLGAILGIAWHLNEDVTRRLQAIVETDDAPEVRTLAQNVLNELGW